MLHLVILAGGSGTRLWPVSRSEKPKQFQKFIGKQTLIQQTYSRIKNLTNPDNIWVIANDNHRNLINNQLKAINKNRIILEPVSRNTAPAVLLAAMLIDQVDRQAEVVVLPADHYIGKVKQFQQTVISMNDFIKKNPAYLGIIGINPTEPSSAYGYIKMGDQIETDHGKVVFKVEQFIEKPDQETAKTFFDSWEYLWNGGFYFFKAKLMINLFKQFEPLMSEQIVKYMESSDKSIYYNLTSAPIDKVIAEKYNQLAVMPADLEWSDLGNWESIQRILVKNGLVQQTVSKKIVLHDCRNCFIVPSKRLVTCVGLNDLIVVDTSDAILITSRSQAELVKTVTEILTQEQLSKYL